MVVPRLNLLADLGDLEPEAVSSKLPLCVSRQDPFTAGQVIGLGLTSRGPFAGSLFLDHDLSTSSTRSNGGRQGLPFDHDLCSHHLLLLLISLSPEGRELLARDTAADPCLPGRQFRSCAGQDVRKLVSPLHMSPPMLMLSKWHLVE